MTNKELVSVAKLEGISTAFLSYDNDDSVRYGTLYTHKGSELDMKESFIEDYSVEEKYNSGVSSKTHLYRILDKKTGEPVYEDEKW